MRRLEVAKRPDWQRKFLELGFSFHSMGGEYWSEGICYEFSTDQIDHLEEVTEELHSLCLKAVEYVITNDLFDKIGINEQAADLVKESWCREAPSIYGRFDFSYDGKNDPKLLEYNADTPTSLYEAGIAQWVWLEEMYPQHDQFNSIHEKLLDAFNMVKGKMPLVSKLYFSSVKDHDEDLVTVEYLRDVASQAGIETQHIFVEDIGFNPGSEKFVDSAEENINFLFKLYPWEWLLNDDFGKYIKPSGITLIEPAWKMVLANKAILPILWEMFPGHKNLLPCFFDPSRLGDTFVKKPFFSREGANIELRKSGTQVATDGTYGSEGYVYQAVQELPKFQGRFAVVGSWIVNGLAAGIGIREDATRITMNTSTFVPHYFI